MEFTNIHTLNQRQKRPSTWEKSTYIKPEQNSRFGETLCQLRLKRECKENLTLKNKTTVTASWKRFELDRVANIRVGTRYLRHVLKFIRFTSGKIRNDRVMQS